jgi:K319-like protein
MTNLLITIHRSPMREDTIIYDVSIELNANASTDLENDITGYSWRKIAGPASFHIGDRHAVQAKVDALAEGV